MAGRDADRAPEGRGAAPKSRPSETLELVGPDLESPAISDFGIVPGTVLDDKYRVEREIGRGGIGVIVAAHHLQLDQRVAIKYLQKKVLGNSLTIERFAREARLAAKIRSDHVVRVHDVATHPELGPYMVMEYLEGHDLGHLVESGPLPVAEAVGYVLQACDGLAAAHALGIVHRDMKPDNLFLAKEPGGGRVIKILDFGVSKGAPSQRTEGGWAHVTTANETFGTPVYMSPEQLRSSASVDARSDVWALGVVLFELLTGDLPFVGETIPQLCTSILVDAPRPLRSLRKAAPAELEATLTRCLERDLARRFRNVAELAQELVRFGPEGSAELLARITRVVEKAGASVRPPTPMPGSFEIGEVKSGAEAEPESGLVRRARPIDDPDAVSHATASPTPTPNESAALTATITHGEQTSPAPRELRRGRAVWIGSALGLLVLGGLVVALRLPDRSTDAHPSAAGPSPIVSAPAAPSVETTPTAGAADPESISVDPVVNEDEAAPDASASAATSPRPPKVIRPKPAGRHNDYSQFGERR